MRRAAALAAIAVAVAAGGCGGGGVGSAMKAAGSGSGDAVVRAWTREVYAGQYDQAASLFAPDAIVQQQDTIVLRTHDDAKAFNISLPCRAKVTTIQHERGGTLLASFDLFPGPGGGCPKGGSARVRFRIVKEHITLWRQLPDAPTPQGQST